MPCHAVGDRLPAWPPRTVFFFFSNRLGCLGSIVASLLLTLLLLFLFGVL